MTATLQVPDEQGTEQTYTLTLHMAPAIALQKRFKTTIGIMLNRAGELDFEAIREMFWLFLQPFHAEQFPLNAPDKVTDLINRAGGPATFFRVLEQLSPTRKAS